jgi:chemotaxis protein MotB
VSAGGPSNRRRRGRGAHGAGGHGNDERWLLTYADMITLLMALFIVMWSMSAVNTGKFNELKLSLKEAFSGKIFPHSSAVLTGERSIMQPKGSQIEPISPDPPRQITPQITPSIPAATAQAARQDLENLRHLQEKIERYALKHHLQTRLSTSIDERGLVIRVLTDQLLFESGSAVVQDPARPLLAKIAQLLTATNLPNDVRVEGNTDNRPISTPQFPSNWELSAARATAVLEVLLADGVHEDRLAVAGYAAERPIAPNSTPEGRQINRRVEIVILRRSLTQGTS